MSGKRVVATSVDWAAFAARIPPGHKPQFGAFKGKSDAYLRGVVSQGDSLKPIDFDAYKSRIAVPGMVDEFKKQYAALTVSYPSSKDYMSKIEDAEKIANSQITDFMKTSNERIEGYKKEKATWEAIPPITSMTMEEYYQAFPDRAINVDNPTHWPHTPESQPDYVPETEVAVEKH